MKDDFVNHNEMSTRRTFLGQGGCALGATALTALLRRECDGRTMGSMNDSLDASPIVTGRPRIRRVIHLYMAGGPSHLETFDPKPKLVELDGQAMPASFTDGQQIAQLQGQRDRLRCLAPQHEFETSGQSGQRISSILPHIQTIADDICIIRSLHTDQINHDPAHSVMNTGSSIPGRPSMGAWLLYGLGSECDDLPGFVVLTSVGGGQSQPIASRQWHSGFLPSEHQGVEFRSSGDPVLYVGRPSGVDEQRQRDVIDAVSRLNQQGYEIWRDPELKSRIAQYELAFKMQMSVPELNDLSDEPKSVLDMYGTTGADGSFASNCLLARRLAERGVRFIQLYHRGWDHHGGIKEGARFTASLVDQGTAALIKDLKQRGMLEDTLVIWGGEFGRTPMAQGSGRDHHIAGYSMFLAGGGVKAGFSYGSTDELGFHAVEDRFHVHDLHATMLHLFGIDHERFTYPFQGRDFRLTDVHGRVTEQILT